MTTIDRLLAAPSATDIGRLLIAPVTAGLALGIGDLGAAFGIAD